MHCSVSQTALPFMQLLDLATIVEREEDCLSRIAILYVVDKRQELCILMQVFRVCTERLGL